MLRKVILWQGAGELGTEPLASGIYTIVVVVYRVTIVAIAHGWLNSVGLLLQAKFYALQGCSLI